MQQILTGLFHRALGVIAGAACALTLAGTAAANTPGRVEFEILRNGRSTGTHVVDVRRVGDVTTATIAIDMAGRVGPFAYAYKHRCTETWRGASLQSMSCTDQEDNKGVQAVRVAVEGGGLKVSGPGTNSSAPLAALPSSWWRADLMGRTQMIDSRTGVVSPISVQRLGVEMVETASGPVQANHYRLRGTSVADIWYDTEGRWVKMSFKIRGQTFVYRARSPVAAAPRA